VVFGGERLRRKLDVDLGREEEEDSRMSKRSVRAARWACTFSMVVSSVVC